MATTIQLPSSLQAFGSQLLPTQRTFIRLKSIGGPPPFLWNSAIGGVPYWPLGMPYPKDEAGNYLTLLIQINWSEVPPFAPFPEHGILQIFVNDDGYYGMNPDDPFDQRNFRVVYHPEITPDQDQLLIDFSFLDDQPTGPLESRFKYGLHFSLEEELIPHEDHRFDQLVGLDFFKQFGEREWEVAREYRQVASGMGHKIGGYPFFTQQDPRPEKSPLELLIQVDTDDEVRIMWGDVGVANFFIHPDDLMNLNFSRVYYHWDCT